ncbi:hypothetical protein L3Y34_002788 [Caenorhabditis briggsae]|uniref:Uncharacterized protein n=1 Tax=Caenorhabditis briggsae TaxID=6238 RepID=A0AAE9IRZ7_CAEBR|nr:hypothetical protein L3Y34_002788 [Caenorhabditis briggsae]
MTTTSLILLHVLAVFKHQPKKPKLERTDQKLADRIISLLQQHEDGNLESYEETTLETCPDEDLDPDYDPEECLESTERNFVGIFIVGNFKSLGSCSILSAQWFQPKW